MKLQYGIGNRTRAKTLVEQRREQARFLLAQTARDKRPGIPAEAPTHPLPIAALHH